MCGNILAIPAVTEREVKHEIPVWWAGRERTVHPTWMVVMGAGATEGKHRNSGTGKRMTVSFQGYAGVNARTT